MGPLVRNGDYTPVRSHRRDCIVKRSRVDFEKLLAEAMPVPPAPPREIRMPQRASDPELRKRIECIKNQVAITTVVERYVKLQKLGSNLVGLCPFHEDHNPSLTVFPATGTFHCFGCRKRGDVITFFREIEHLGFSDALDRLSQPS